MMKIGVVEIGAFAGSFTRLAYKIAVGGYVEAALTPVVAAGVIAAAEHYNYKKVSNIGVAILLAGALTVPGPAVGYATYAIAGKTLVAQGLGYAAGCFTTYKICSIISEIMRTN